MFCQKVYLYLEGGAYLLANVGSKVAHGSGEDAEETVQHPILSQQLGVSSECDARAAHRQSNWD